MDVRRTEPIILTHDLSAMRDFYSQKLGLEVVSDNGHVVAFHNGISMHPRSDRPFRADAVANTVDIALWVTDLYEAAAELRERGVTFTTEPFDEGPILLAMVTDPEGNDILLMQRKPG